jgi:hypothetical protein
MPDKRYTRVEEEVIQILDRLENESPSPSRANLRLVPQRQKRRWMPRWNVSHFAARVPWLWIATALGLALAAILVRDVSQNLTLLLAIASIVAFFAPIVLNRRPASSESAPPGTKTWRGRDIAFEPPRGDSLGERIRRWRDGRRRRL